MHPQLRDNNAERQSEKEVAKKVLKNLVVKKKGFTFAPTFASEIAAIFLAPRRKVGYQKRFFDLLVYKREKECRKHEVLKTSQVQFNSF